MVAAAELAVDRVKVSARRTAPADDLADRGRALGLTVETVPWERVEQAFACDAIVVTLPGDAAANLVSAIPAEPGVLLDVTYHPWPTSLATAWEQRSGSVVGIRPSERPEAVRLEEQREHFLRLSTDKFFTPRSLHSNSRRPRRSL